MPPSEDLESRGAKNRGGSYTSSSVIEDSETQWTSWLVPMFVVANVAVFVVAMYINNCPKENSRAQGKCVAGFLGRFSFQPLKENPLFGPSSKTWGVVLWYPSFCLCWFYFGNLVIGFVLEWILGVFGSCFFFFCVIGSFGLCFCVFGDWWNEFFFRRMVLWCLISLRGFSSFCCENLRLGIGLTWIWNSSLTWWLILDTHLWISASCRSFWFWLHGMNLVSSPQWMILFNTHNFIFPRWFCSLFFLIFRVSWNQSDMHLRFLFNLFPVFNNSWTSTDPAWVLGFLVSDFCGFLIDQMF